ncbi:unknown [Firmicutes bacterium CAG:791]|nr:unknown [Firmicutes bacterium CAG:791]
MKHGSENLIRHPKAGRHILHLPFPHKLADHGRADHLSLILLFSDLRCTEAALSFHPAEQRKIPASPVSERKIRSCRDDRRMKLVTENLPHKALRLHACDFPLKRKLHKKIHTHVIKGPSFLLPGGKNASGKRSEVHFRQRVKGHHTGQKPVFPVQNFLKKNPMPFMDAIKFTNCNRSPTRKVELRKIRNNLHYFLSFSRESVS